MEYLSIIYSYLLAPTAVYQHENTSIHCTVLMEKYYDQWPHLNNVLICLALLLVQNYFGSLQIVLWTPPKMTFHFQISHLEPSQKRLVQSQNNFDRSKSIWKCLKHSQTNLNIFGSFWPPNPITLTFSTL